MARISSCREMARISSCREMARISSCREMARISSCREMARIYHLAAKWRGYHLACSMWSLTGARMLHSEYVCMRCMWTIARAFVCVYSCTEISHGTAELITRIHMYTHQHEHDVKTNANMHMYQVLAKNKMLIKEHEVQIQEAKDVARESGEKISTEVKVNTM